MGRQEEFEQLVKELVAPPQSLLSEVDLATPPSLNAELNLPENGKEIFNRRYRRRDADGNYTESIEETYMRVASHIAKAEETPEAEKYFTHVFYNLLTKAEFIPNAPTWTGAGTPLGQLAACFVLPIEDDMGSNPAGIFSTMRDAALIQQTGGGNGFSFSRLRPRGDRVSKSMGKATGPIGFLEVYDQAFGEIAQGGARRGANMAVLRVDHPDIREFIACKTKEGSVRNFNISVAVTDKFMEAVKYDREFELINPRNGEVWEKVQAREIFDMITENAHRNGEPGILFIDEANRFNPVPNQYEIEATNPCGEQFLGPYENCCLGHVNLARHVVFDDHGARIDWDHLARTIHEGTHFLDNIVTMNSYVPAVPSLKQSAHHNRRIGLGFTGLADVMYMMGVRYGSEKGIDFAGQIAEYLRYHSMQASIELAKNRGAFPGIKGSIYDYEQMTWQPPKPLEQFSHDWNRPLIDWTKVEDGIRKNGIRNAAQMTVAPTGSTSTVLGVEGYGCEPVFALAYFRNVYQAAGMEENLTLRYVSPLFQAKLDELNLDQETKDRIIDQVIEKGSLREVEGLPNQFKETFVVSDDITPDEHVLTQAALQAFIDNAISKTCNLPEESTHQDIQDVYFKAWESKCKGLTVYRTGSRQEVVLETKETKDKKKVEDATAISPAYVVRPREKVLSGETQKVNTPLGNMYLTVNKTQDDDYHEVFINLGNAGSDVRADTEAIGKLISLIFRLGSADSNQRMKAIIAELSGISSGMVSGFNGDRVLSVPDAIAKSLKRVDQPEQYAEQTEMALFDKHNALDPGMDSGDRVGENSTKEMCPFCGNYSVMMVEGCKKCNVQLGGCGEYSAC